MVSQGTDCLDDGFRRPECHTVPVLTLELGHAIAERAFTYVDPVSGATEISVKLGAPQQLSDSGSWCCPWQIAGVGDEKVRCAIGIDGFQALQLVMNMIGATLHAQMKQGVKLHRLDGEDSDLGFPEV
jgi:hypothetical protein